VKEMITDSEYYPALLRSYGCIRYGYMVCGACDVVCVGYPNEVKSGCEIGHRAEWKWVRGKYGRMEDEDL